MTSQSLKTSDIIYVAAADSSESDKKIADFVCDGKNDQATIQTAINTIETEKAGEIRGARIVLLGGNYFIGAFSHKNQYSNVAIMMPSVTNRYQHIGILIAGSEHTEATAIHLSTECYNSLNTTESYSIFGCGDVDWEHTNWNHHVFKDIYVTVPDDQKNVICFDGRNMGSMGLRRCKCLCETRGDWSNPKEKLPVEGFVAFMGTCGSNNMWESKWEFCQAEGFGQGFAVGSEHLYMQKCAAAFGKYGYTFNNYPCNFGAVVHPITMVSCSDEANGNLWKFGKNKFKQYIKATNISFELVPAWFELGGDYAKEVNPGDYAGHVDFVGNRGMVTHNDVGVCFWEGGSGIGFETVNNMHKKVCGSEERKNYYPQIGQTVFDTDLGKLLTFTGDGWFDSLGNLAD